MRARPAERERAVLLVLYLVEEVQDPVHRGRLDLVRRLVRRRVPFGVIAEDAKLDLHRVSAPAQ
jgi:hypothetical protein